MIWLWEVIMQQEWLSAASRSYSSWEQSLLEQRHPPSASHCCYDCNFKINEKNNNKNTRQQNKSYFNTNDLLSAGSVVERTCSNWASEPQKQYSSLVISSPSAHYKPRYQQIHRVRRSSLYLSSQRDVPVQNPYREPYFRLRVFGFFFQAGVFPQGGFAKSCWTQSQSLISHFLFFLLLPFFLALLLHGYSKIDAYDARRYSPSNEI